MWKRMIGCLAVLVWAVAVWGQTAPARGLALVAVDVLGRRKVFAIGIGLFIVLIGMDSTRLLLRDPGTGWRLNPHFGSPDLVVFFFGLLVTAALHAKV